MPFQSIFVIDEINDVIVFHSIKCCDVEMCSFNVMNLTLLFYYLFLEFTNATTKTKIENVNIHVQLISQQHD